MLKKIRIPNITELKKQNFKNIKVRSSASYEFLKRLFDLLFSIMGIILLWPLFLILILLIRIDSPGRVIFSQQRSKNAGEFFSMYKFRTMYLGVKNQDFAPTGPNDPRVTRIGKILRRTSLDELPQLWNILTGEMSVVGPRPEMTFISEKYNEIERQRLLVKPGLTGLWQIYGRKDLPLHENVELDLYYIEHRSFFLDLFIILRTFITIIHGKGAY